MWQAKTSNMCGAWVSLHSKIAWRQSRLGNAARRRLRLRNILLNGEIPPGARIPERDLCTRLQISRTPLREALKVLAAEGLVLLLPHRGSRAAKLTSKDVQDLFEVCQGLEA
ncbi:MAG: GntR family transcriptional regulator, partial [Pseudolabrys sp.]